MRRCPTHALPQEPERAPEPRGTRAPRRRAPGALALLALAAALGGPHAAAASAGAPDAPPPGPPPPVGGGALANAPPDDAATPNPGRPVVSPVQRPDARDVPQRTCSFTLPLCVHAPAGVPGAALLEGLAHLEAAMHTYDALGLPRPLPDGQRGGGPSYDLYLERGPRRGPIRVGHDMRALGERFDTTSAFAVVAAPGRGGCASASDAAYALAHAVAARLDAGAEEGALAMAASYLASLAAPCAAEELAAVDAFQRTPERALTGAALGAIDGAFLFPWYLDQAHGTGAPAQIATSLLAIAAQSTPAGALRFRGEPDTFDALRESLRFRGKDLGDVLLDFAVARAFLGSRSDGAHLAGAERFGDLGRVRFEWSLPYATLPRRVAPLRPIEPTGATYLWLDLSAAGAAAPADLKAAEINLVAEWELPAVFRWAIVKVDTQGAEAGRVEVAGVVGSSRAERTVVGLDGLAGLLLVGVNAGSMIRSRPFDPDDAPFMPHAYTVTLFR
ncbi:uncharacterized protein SOCE26_105030 [Sorangium cellulosum]|uniref:Uncharacterized protein n=1 Tax=Sorangium cellulosum TaxID=56 RepID=A0A2L0FBH7_SORCE|nr:hypothetical protein [Sorangium cellulosum]AUX48958.1 uncharacterized protein SOCE26_105030 [Sorangium cellulosum]